MAKEMLRQGGRSARIQKAVHEVTRALLDTTDRATLSVPLIAEQAGVTPSTIYRRWGSLAELLADVAAERLRPIADPEDTGTTAGDLKAFVLTYAEEMSSPVGRALLRDVITQSADDTSSYRCCQYTSDHLHLIATRASLRGESGFQVAEVVDQVIAPICYHILFNDRDVGADYALELLDRLDVAD